MLPVQTMLNQCVNVKRAVEVLPHVSLVPAARFSTVFRKTLIVRKLEVSLSPAASRRVGRRSVRRLASRTDASAEGDPAAEEESGMPEEWKHFKEKASQFSG